MSASSQDITCFHGRYPYDHIKNDVVKIYSSSDGINVDAKVGLIRKYAFKVENFVRRILSF